MTPVCSWQECLQPVSLIKTFPCFFRLSSQINVLFTTLPTPHPITPSPCCPVYPWGGNFCWICSYSKCLWYFGKHPRGPALLSTAPPLPRAEAPRENAEILHACHRLIELCWASLRLGYQPGHRALLWAGLVGTWLLWSTEEINNIPKNYNLAND